MDSLLNSFLYFCSSWIFTSMAQTIDLGTPESYHPAFSNMSWSRWWQLKYFLCSPQNLGKMKPFSRAYVRMGWFNHQPRNLQTFHPPPSGTTPPLRRRRVKNVGGLCSWDLPNKWRPTWGDLWLGFEGHKVKSLRKLMKISLCFPIRFPCSSCVGSVWRCNKLIQADIFENCHESLFLEDLDLERFCCFLGIGDLVHGGLFKYNVSVINKNMFPEQLRTGSSNLLYLRSYTVDGSEIWLTGWYGKYRIICRVSYMLGGAGFLPSTVSFHWLLLLPFWDKKIPFQGRTVKTSGEYRSFLQCKDELCRRRFANFRWWKRWRLELFKIKLHLGMPWESKTIFTIGKRLLDVGMKWQKLGVIQSDGIFFYSCIEWAGLGVHVSMPLSSPSVVSKGFLWLRCKIF